MTSLSRRWGIWILLFFFSSRRRHTRLQGDWSSDVCSSDLASWPRCRSVSSRYGGNVRSWERRPGRKIGRASCRERGEISVGAVSLKKKKKKMSRGRDAKWVEIRLYIKTYRRKKE